MYILTYQNSLQTQGNSMDSCVSPNQVGHKKKGKTIERHTTTIEILLFLTAARLSAGGTGGREEAQIFIDILTETW